jgi:hypothetical protein
MNENNSEEHISNQSNSVLTKKEKRGLAKEEKRTLRLRSGQAKKLKKMVYWFIGS